MWWRLDAALDLEMLRWSALLGAVEALQCGTTGIVDHHESPNAIEGSLTAIADACAEVGVRVVCAYGVTDRWQDDGSLWSDTWPPPAMTDAARRGLAENERFLRAGGKGLVGVHAAFTCSDETLGAAAGLAADLGVGVHIHVAEGDIDRGAGQRLAPLAADDWLLVHCVHLDRDLPGTIAHNPRSNMNNAVGYAAPARRPNPVVLGTDGIGADMLEEARLAYVRPPGRRRAGHARHHVVLAGGGLDVRARGPRRHRDLELRPRRLALARGLHPRRAGPRRRPVGRRGAPAGRLADAGRRRRGPGQGRRAGPAPLCTTLTGGRS